MIRTASFASTGFVFCLLGSAAPRTAAPTSKAAEQLIDDYRSALVKLEEDFQKDLEPVKADYLKALTQARKRALANKELAEAQRIADAIKGIDEVVAPTQVVAMRQRLSNTSWEWGPDQILRLNFNGTVTMSWQEKVKGYWQVNPDLTVVHWRDDYPNAYVLTFNANCTAFELSVPNTDVKGHAKRTN